VKIVHVVTLISPDAEFGGPVRVALEQCKELMRRGHHVTILAAGGRFGDLPDTIEGVPVRLLSFFQVPGLGFSGIFAPKLYGEAKDLLNSADLAHIHATRDLISLPVAVMSYRRNVPYVLQCHGMIDPSSKRLAALIDSVWTRSVLRRASAILALTQREEIDVRAVARRPSLAIERITNGLPRSETPTGTSRRADTVLFLARLQTRKKPLAFVEMAAELVRRGVNAFYVMAGPDEGMASAVRDSIDYHSLAKRFTFLGSQTPKQVKELFGEATIYVLPAIDEPFPMTVIEAMSAATPVVITTSCGLADMVTEYEAGIVCAPDVAELATAVEQLLDDPIARARMGRNGRELITCELSIETVVDSLESVYTDSVDA
jgi:glycosyltransferase involved in cell wall biosynthesis